MGRIVGAIVLPGAWINRMLAEIHLTDDVEKVRLERIQAEQRLRRLGKAYVEGLYADDEYRREKRALEEKWSSLLVTGVNAARETGKLLEDLPNL